MRRAWLGPGAATAAVAAAACAPWPVNPHDGLICCWFLTSCAPCGRACLHTHETPPAAAHDGMPALPPLCASYGPVCTILWCAPHGHAAALLLLLHPSTLPLHPQDVK